MIGTMLLHYEVKAQLGSGGSARVYLADDTRTGRKVALKMMTATVRRDPQSRERIAREARASAMLDHSGIVRLYSFEEADGQTFLVYEYVEGETLAERVKRGPLPTAAALDLAETLASALTHAHEHGVEHRDIKPTNVMVTHDGRYKLLDFGIVRLAGAVTITDSGVVLGSLPYLAPERIRGERGDLRADLYGLGLVYYIALSGRHPHGGGNEAQMLSAIVNQPPVPLTGLPEQAQPLADLALELLQKDPAQRPASAEAVLERVRRMRSKP